MPQILKCPSCAAPLQHDGRSSSIQCEYCNNIILMPEESRHAASPPPNNPFGSSDPFANFAPQINLSRLIEINDLMHSGRKIEAIKLFRETFSVGLKEAKEAVERLEHGEAINLGGEQRIMAFHADLQNHWIDKMNRSEMVINVGTTGSVIPGNVTSHAYVGSHPIEQKKTGCIAAFIGQFGCLVFSFFWIAFLIMMVGPLFYPGMVLATAPILCDDGYQEAVAERVAYYSTGNFEGNNIVLLHCIYEAGSQETVHPMLVMGIIFAVPMVILTVIAFGLSFLGRIGAIVSSD